MKKLYGVITAMTTPFTNNNEVDVEGLEQQVDFLIGKGIHCLYPCGTTGEMFLMSVEERKLVAETVVQQASGRVPVFVHTGAMNEADTLELSKHACSIGAAGVGIVTPSYFCIDERAMFNYYKSLSSQLPDDFSIYVYVIPQLSRNDISYELLEKIAEYCPNVVGVKYSYPDMRRVNDYLMIRDRHFSVVPGADDLFLPSLVCGCDGVVSGCSGPFPEPFLKIYDCFQQGDLDGALRAQVEANKIIKLMKFGADMSIFKNILSWRGVQSGHMRKPLLDLNARDLDLLKEQVLAFAEDSYLIDQF